MGRADGMFMKDVSIHSGLETNLFIYLFLKT